MKTSQSLPQQVALCTGGIAENVTNSLGFIKHGYYNISRRMSFEFGTFK